MYKDIMAWQEINNLHSNSVKNRDYAPGINGYYSRSRWVKKIWVDFTCYSDYSDFYTSYTEASVITVLSMHVNWYFQLQLIIRHALGWIHPFLPAIKYVHTNNGSKYQWTQFSLIQKKTIYKIPLQSGYSIIHSSSLPQTADPALISAYPSIQFSVAVEGPLNDSVTYSAVKYLPVVSML